MFQSFPHLVWLRHLFHLQLFVWLFVLDCIELWVVSLSFLILFIDFVYVKWYHGSKSHVYKIYPQQCGSPSISSMYCHSPLFHSMYSPVINQISCFLFFSSYSYFCTNKSFSSIFYFPFFYRKCDIFCIFWITFGTLLYSPNDLSRKLMHVSS